MLNRSTVLPCAALVALAGAAASAHEVDGRKDASYGSPVWVQNVPTGFGDSTLGDEHAANGSELDGLFIEVHDDYLFMLFTGNMETNYNHLEIFIDALPGGQNPLRTDNVDIDFNGLNRLGGLTFDAAFVPDYWLNFTTGGGGGPTGIDHYVSAAVLRTDGYVKDFNGNSLDYGSYDGGDKADHDPMLFAGPRLDIQDGFTAYVYANYGPRIASDNLQANPTNPAVPPSALIQADIDNSNTGGVTGSDASDAANVTTGVEIAIALEELGLTPGQEATIRIAAFINSSDHGFVSNQVVGGLPTTDNLGEPSVINFDTIAGNQYVEITVGDHGCYADYDGNGSVNTLDFIAFLNDFNDGVVGQDDCDENGIINTLDFICFLNAFNTPC